MESQNEIQEYIKKMGMHDKDDSLLIAAKLAIKKNKKLLEELAK